MSKDKVVAIRDYSFDYTVQLCTGICKSTTCSYVHNYTCMIIYVANLYIHYLDNRQLHIQKQSH